MSEHDCQHEVELALMAQTIKNIDKNVEGLCKTIQGKEDKPGLKTKVALLAASVKRIYIIGTPIAVLLIGSSVKVVFFGG